MTRLSRSIARTEELLERADFAVDNTVAELLAETHARRVLDLSDLSPTQQAGLIADRTVDVLPSVDALAETIARRQAAGGQLVVKFGIDPTGADVHLGHVVPMLVMSRFQRMGHDVVLIVGDVTAKIGDPSGRVSDRPHLTDAQIAENLRTYRRQVSPFFDFDRAAFRHNSEWLGEITLPQLIELLAQIPVSASLQREDFRERLAAGHGLTMAEFMYSVVMALDSVALNPDVEIGGVDQLLNMQMCRRLMAVSDQPPEIVVTTALIEGTDGVGTKMSKSAKNDIPVTSAPDDMYGKVMSIPDRLVVPYLKAWTEWSDQEIATLVRRWEAGEVHPMDAKKILAGEAVAAIYGPAAATDARREFVLKFSQRSFDSLDSLSDLDVSSVASTTVAAVLVEQLAFAPSLSAARRLARQRGVRLVIGPDAARTTVVLGEDDVIRSLDEVVTGATSDAGGLTAGPVYLKVGRRITRLVNWNRSAEAYGRTI